MKRKKKIIIILSSILGFFIIIAVAFIIYTSDYYHATEDAKSALVQDELVTINKIKDEYIVFEPANPIAGYIFYPGGKVDYKAYAPLLRELALNDILCVLTKMPFNLAVFNQNAASGIKELYPDIDEWYLSGHSLGGSMAASYLEGHHQNYEGIILLAAYSTVDLSNTSLNCLTIYGSNDGVLNMKKLEKNKKNLPINAKEFVIEGGNHAFFGFYGKQKGDNEASISQQTQLELTVSAIKNLIEKKVKKSS